MSLEVGEHVSEAAGEALVRFLTKCADVVVWLAVIPGQGGHDHINERSQDYWVAQFADAGFIAFDLIRPEIWYDARGAVGYRENVLVFANAAGQKAHQLEVRPFLASVVHPLLCDSERDPQNYSLLVVAKIHLITSNAD
jgi:hypothetical protein